MHVLNALDQCLRTMLRKAMALDLLGFYFIFNLRLLFTLFMFLKIDCLFFRCVNFLLRLH